MRQARWAIALVFAVHGAVTGSFATRIPWIQDHAGVSSGQLGFALAFPAIGAALAMPLAGRISHRLGARAAQRFLLALWCISLAPPAFSPGLSTLCLALFGYGSMSGMADVAMNALGVETERRLGRSIMSGLHGMWSVGVLVGSAAGTAAAHTDVDARLHLPLAAGLLTVLGILACRGVLDLRSTPGGQPPPRFALPPRSALPIGAIGFCAVFAEGASLDWAAVYLRDALGASAGAAAACTTAFTCTMAIARLIGDALVERFGPVRAIRTGGVLATLGGTMVVTAAHPAAAMGGFALIGLGVALVVPLAFAAAGRAKTGGVTPGRSSAGGPAPSQSIAGVATITYTSGLIAPSAMGSIAYATSLTVSFGLVTALACAIVLAAGVLRPAQQHVEP
ncbi:MFS transporter [Streptomyces aureocirculatus]|uniref:MFS transporter n=1 Tax=Streptomyces aureocirculatus TaxID=67275 RepID=UPI000A82D005